MRNPIRLKNLSLRLMPYYLLGILFLVVSDVTSTSFAVGVVPIVFGLVLRGWSAGHLVKNDRFTTTGPYAHLRHPFYLGTILVATGFALMLGEWASLAALVLIFPWFFLSYFPRKERVESQRLQRRYGESYALYRKEVPALLPRMAAWRPERVPGLERRGRPRWNIARWDANNELGPVLASSILLGLLALRASHG